MPKHIKKVNDLLSSLFNIVLKEIEVNKDFANQIEKAIKTYVQEKERPVEEPLEAETNINQDDFFQQKELVVNLGEMYLTSPDNFRNWLNNLSVDQLRSIIKENHLDPMKSIKRKTNDQVIRDFIFERISSAYKKSVFRHYQQEHTVNGSQTSLNTNIISEDHKNNSTNQIDSGTFSEHRSPDFVNHDLDTEISSKSASIENEPTVIFKKEESTEHSLFHKVDDEGKTS